MESRLAENDSRPLARARLAIFAGAIVLLVLVVAVFHPIVGFEFVRLDVGGHVHENPRVHGLNWQNVKQIFTSRCATSYYPVRSLSFALDYQLWGLSAAGFKLTNGLIHAANVLLLFWLMLRLFPQQSIPFASSYSVAVQRDVCPAVFGAAIFAIHPVVVEPVTWVSGREELLMTLGALACVHFHLTARRLSEHGGRLRWVLSLHVLAALSCAAACLSNAVGAVIPLLIVALDVSTMARPTPRRILAGTAALWGIGVATVIIKKLGEFRDPPSEVGAWSIERLLLILNAYWSNLKTLVWPTELAVFYDPLAPQGFCDIQVALGALAVVLTLTVLWVLRRQKLVLLGLIWFLIALTPGSQVIVHHIHRADRFLYLPLVGLALAVAMGLRCLESRIRHPVVLTATTVVGVLVFVLLGTLSAAQVRTWRNDAAMWENCVKVNPDNVRYRVSLADCLASRGEFGRAIEQYEHVLRLVPEHEPAIGRLAWLLASAPDGSLRDQDRAVRLIEYAFDRNPLFFRALADIRVKVAESLLDSDELAAAIDSYRSAIQVDPGSHQAMFQLALLLAACDDADLRSPAEAVELAERACLVHGQPGAWELSVLAAAYHAAGQSKQAVSTAQRALELARADDNATLIERLHERLRTWSEPAPDPELP
jgi:protein O-mannosyl-transferase